ncbi:MAG: hypothetical protein ACKVPJ_04370 [Chitinophagales bacterium]
MTMLEYFKMILQKVSFDISLFRSELNKALQSLTMEERNELKRWCIQTFGLPFCKQAMPDFSL